MVAFLFSYTVKRDCKRMIERAMLPGISATTSSIHCVHYNLFKSAMQPPHSIKHKHPAIFSHIAHRADLERLRLPAP